MSNLKTIANTDFLVELSKNSENMEEAQKAKKALEAIEAITEYRDIGFSRYFGNMNLQVLVYELYRQTKYKDAINDYPYVMQELIEALARPQVNEVIRKYISLDRVIDI